MFFPKAFSESNLLLIGVGIKVKDIIGASLIELGEDEVESEDLFASGDAEALSALAHRASHKPPLVNGRVYEVKT